MEAVGSLFPFVLILAAFYLLIIRPARTRTRAATQLQEQLTPGLEVMTTSGIFATVVSVQDDSVDLQVSPGVNVRFAKAAVGRIVTVAEDAATEEESRGADQARLRSEDGAPDRPESDQSPR